MSANAKYSSSAKFKPQSPLVGGKARPAINSRRIGQPIFYGWVIVAISMVSGFIGAGVSNITMAVMLKPITEDLGWSRSIMGLAVMLGSVAGGVLSPFFGPVVDRYGPRYLLPAGAFLVGALAMGIGFSSETWHFYATYVPARAFTEFLLIGLVPMTAVTNWFHAKRPRAMGLVAMSVPLGSAILSIVYQLLIDSYGWRTAFLVLASALWFLVLPPAWLLMRRHPEDLGLCPDGAISGEGGQSLQSHFGAKEFSWQLRNALRSTSLWFLVIGLFLSQVSAGGVGFHVMAYCTDLGISPIVAAGVLSVMALAGAFGNTLWGALAEPIHPRLVAIITLVISAAAVALLTLATSPLLLYLFAVLFGFHARCTPVLTQIIMARYYGRRHYATISSTLDPFHKCGLGLGALMAGAAHDWTGSYQGAFIGFLACYVISATLMCFASSPRVRINQRRLRTRLNQIQAQPAYDSVQWEQWFSERRQAKGSHRQYFERKYRDKRVVWTGVVSSIQEKWDGTVMVYVKKESSDLNTAFFKFAAKDAAAARELAKNSRITVTGVFDTMIVNPFFRESQVLGYDLEAPRDPVGEAGNLRAL